MTSNSKDNYTSRVTRRFELLDELLTKYPEGFGDIEDSLKDIISYYKDRENYVPQEKVEVKSIVCKILPPVVREPLALNLED